MKSVENILGYNREQFYRLVNTIQKAPKSELQSQFSMSKIIQIFLILFSIKKYSSGEHFLLRLYVL